MYPYDLEQWQAYDKHPINNYQKKNEKEEKEKKGGRKEGRKETEGGRE